MYEDFFHLRKNPFGMNPDPKCLFMTTSHRETFAGLLYAILRRKGFFVLTGDAGTGKTTLLRALMLSTDAAQFSVILTPRLTADEFLEMALLDFGLAEVPSSKSQRIASLQRLLLELRVKGKIPVLIVDEAHTLSPETLEEIRLLTNFETSEEKLLQIVLAGQDQLAETLNRDDLRQLKQRIEVRMNLKPLEATEVAAYMRHRWSHAGASTPLPFAPDAIALIAKASGGIPRLVNSICDNALLLAYASETSAIGAGQVQHVLRDLDLSEAGPSRKAPARTGARALRLADFARHSTEPPPPKAGASRVLIEDDAPFGFPQVSRWHKRTNMEPVQRGRNRL
jgi:general secretion pathway protein A